MFSDLVGSTALSARMDPEICASLFGLPNSQGEAARSYRRRVGWPCVGSMALETWFATMQIA